MKNEAILKEVEKLISERLKNFGKSNPKFTLAQYRTMQSELVRDLDSLLQNQDIKRDSELYFSAFRLYEHFYVGYLENPSKYQK